VTLPRFAYDHGYWGIALARPPEYVDAMRLELHPKGGVLVVPRLEPDRIGLGVLVHPDEEPLFRSGTLEAKLAAVRERSRLFEGLTPYPEGAHLYRLSRAHARRYVAPGVALLGDAIHVTNPVAGQGMTMAIEDAAALARHAGAALAAGHDVDRALLAYQAERRPRNATILRWSHWMSHAYAHPGGGADWVRRGVLALGGTALGRRVHGAIYGALATRRRPS
jgi:2-polyprenyl-6-methoxyphenol hydroxylase-like FAD-dependent oxidoreductase